MWDPGKGQASVLMPLYDDLGALIASIRGKQARWTLATSMIRWGRNNQTLGLCICKTSMHDVLYSNSSSQAMHSFRYQINAPGGYSLSRACVHFAYLRISQHVSMSTGSFYSQTFEKRSSLPPPKLPPPAGLLCTGGGLLAAGVTGGALLQPPKSSSGATLGGA